MSDFSSSLPIRTEANGDVAVKLVDGTVNSQSLAIDSSGRVITKIQDGAGNALASSTTTPIGTEQALITRNIPSGTQAVSGTVAATQSGTWSTRTQDGLGNAITSSTAGSTRPFDVALRDSSGALLGTALNPISVAVSADVVGAEVVDYNTAAAVAAAGTSNHTYTVTTAKTLLLKQIEASGSGKAKIEVQIETGVATNVFVTKFVQFNSTATPNFSIHLESPQAVAAGVRVRIIRTNRDQQAQDLFSTILGQEV